MAGALIIGIGAGTAEPVAGHTVIAAQDVKWGPAPPMLPPGAQAALLMGDPSKAGPYAIRLRAPKGYAIPPHTHPTQEAVTVLSGTFRFGLGNKADRDTAQVLGAGGFFVVAPGHAHYVFADEDSVIPVNSMGPFVIDYVNAADDPRQKK